LLDAMMVLCLDYMIINQKRITNMQYQRKDRVGDLIKREVSQMIQQELKDPGIGFVTVTGVEVSPDLKRAKIFYSVLGEEDSKRESASALKRACGFIQHEIGKRLRLKHIPEISFQFDSSVEYGAHIEELIQKIHQKENTQMSGMDAHTSSEDESTSNENGENEG